MAEFSGNLELWDLEINKPLIMPVIKTVFLFTLIKVVLDLLGHYLIIPLLPEKIFPSEDFPDQALGVYTLIVMVIVCIFLVKKLNQLRPDAPIFYFFLWGAICIFFGEMLFQVMMTYIFNGAEVNGSFKYIVSESLIFAIQAGFISNVVIHYQRSLLLLIPILLLGGLFFLLDYMFANNWL